MHLRLGLNGFLFLDLKNPDHVATLNVLSSLPCYQMETLYDENGISSTIWEPGEVSIRSEEPPISVHPTGTGTESWRAYRDRQAQAKSQAAE